MRSLVPNVVIASRFLSRFRFEVHPQGRLPTVNNNFHPGT